MSEPGDPTPAAESPEKMVERAEFILQRYLAVTVQVEALLEEAEKLVLEHPTPEWVLRVTTNAMEMTAADNKLVAYGQELTSIQMSLPDGLEQEIYTRIFKVLGKLGETQRASRETAQRYFEVASALQLAIQTSDQKPQ